MAFALLAVIIPSVSLAAWWNPFSWGDKEESVYIEPYVGFTEPEVEEETIPDPIVIEKPVLRTETITVSDPEQQAQIDALIAENNALHEEVYNLEVNNIVLTTSLQACEDKPVSVATIPVKSDNCTDAQEEVVAVNQELLALLSTYQAKRDEVYNNHNLVISQADSMIAQINLDEKQATDTTNAELSLAQSQVELYCN